MDYDKLEKLKYQELKNIAKELNAPLSRNKEELLVGIIQLFKEYENYKNKKKDKFTVHQQLGNKGKEGITYLVTKKDGTEWAMKTFKKTKSADRIYREAELQKKAAEFGVSPKVIDVDTVVNYIVMEKMDKHLLDVLKKQGGLKKTQQKQIINIFKKLDEANVFHADANLMNYMFLGRKLYIIDFGMAKEITNALIKKLGTNTPNLNIMTLGFILKLKEMQFSYDSYDHLIKFLNEDQIKTFNL